uniref:Neur_chan_LBD domain-containing protein n=1 Tax=Macrostomum lignano TaxID=282301 RepID=A0A1I8H113_9PLAT
CVRAASESDWRPRPDEQEEWSPGDHRWPVEKRLTTQLLSRYAQWGIVGRPVVNSSDVMTVRLGLALIQILDLEENKQMLRTNCWLRFTWRDNLLSWENWTEPEFRAIRQIRVAPSQIWTPDIKLYNFADERTMEIREARVVVDRSGEVLWIPQALLKTTCQVTIMHFPFDTQLCCIRFGSWTYDERQLLLDWSMTDLRLNDTYSIQKLLPFVDFSDYVESNEWETDGESEMDVADPDDRIMQIRSGVTYRHEPAHDWLGRPLQKKFRLLEYRIRMMRNPSFYVAILVVPCILLSMLTLVVFCLPPEAPAKMLLGEELLSSPIVL